MRPVLSREEMRRVDEAALQALSLQELVERAGFAVARHAIELLGGAYAKVVIVICGKGHNGDDGRVAARLLARRGAKVQLYEVGHAPDVLPSCDLVIDAAFGTGFYGTYVAPRPPAGAKVLAIDIASGLDADSGVADASAVHADLTVTMGALKPGLMLGQGPARSGRVVVEPIGLALGSPRQHLLEDEDLTNWLPARQREAHKWQAALAVVAGSPGMAGAAHLCSLAALRAGSGMVRLASPGAKLGNGLPLEVVALHIEQGGFAPVVLEQLARCKALVLGPGLGAQRETVEAVLALVAEAKLPLVLDADGLNALGPIEASGQLLASRTGPTVLTPHEGEFARLFGAPGEDRIASVREAAARASSVVLLKGATTVIAAPDGEVLLVASGSPALATAGTGDVLSGIIGAFLARGLGALQAAGLAAHLHGLAAQKGLGEGLVASDLPRLVAEVIQSARSASA